MHRRNPAIFHIFKPYNVIVIGPGCDVNNNSGSSPYFFVDRLALAELADFDIPFADIIGDLCQEGLTIVAEDDPGIGGFKTMDQLGIIQL